jgi:hypothetical protein
MFDVFSCKDFANSGRLDKWVDSYLDGGPWANEGLREGLGRQRRYWIGPLLIPLDRLERCCGPEPDMEYFVPHGAWAQKVAGISCQLSEPMSVPPLIVEWRDGKLSVRDGNHRHAAMAAVGWQDAWVVVWCNSADDYDRAREALGITER